MTDPQILAEELADTLAAARAKRKLPANRAAAAPLTRDLVGEAPPTLGVCCFCGAVAPQATVCEAHEDLVPLDDPTSEVVTTSTNGPGRNHLDGGRAARARR